MEFWSPIAQTPCAFKGSAWEVLGYLKFSEPLPLSRHQVLRISAADEAQVQKVKELEDLEHLQVRDSMQASPRTQETS